MPTNTNAAEERHLARLCYLLGYASHRLPAETQLQWELADVGDPLPPPVVEAFCQVETCAAELAAWPSCGRKRKLRAACSEVGGAAARLRAGVALCWGSPGHARFVRFRTMAEAELDRDLFMEEAPHRDVPVCRRLWHGLNKTARECWLELPTRTGRWGELGAAVAALSGGHGTAWHEANVRFDTIHSALAAAPPGVAEGMDLSGEAHLAALAGDATPPCFRPPFDWWAAGEVARYHGRTLERLSGGSAGPAAEENAGALPPGVSKEVLAIALLLGEEVGTIDQIAETVGVSRQTLYRWPRFARTLEAIRSGRNGRPKGMRRRGGDGRAEVDGVCDSNE